MMRQTASISSQGSVLTPPSVTAPVRVTRDKARSAARRAEQREFRITLYALFAVFLVVAALCRLLPASWRPFGCSGEKRSFIRDARAAANEVTPFIFMR